MPQLLHIDPETAISSVGPVAHSPAKTASVDSEAGHMTVDLGQVVLEIVTETRAARAQLTMTDGRWQVRIVDAA